MTTAFGPWATAISLRSGGQLRTFLKRRLTLLVPISRTTPQLSRRAIFGIVALGVLACAVPTFQQASVQAVPKDGATAHINTRIYADATLKYRPEGQIQEKTQNKVLIAIDPDIGQWQRITDDGSNVRVSPDRQTLAFIKTEQRTNRDDGLWTCDIHGRNSRKLFEKTGRPVWSPDGKHLVVTQTQVVGDRTKYETWRLDADGSNPTLLAVPDTDRVNDWSPDGQWFVTSSNRDGGGSTGTQIYIMKTDGTQPRRLTKAGGNELARFSPDGRKILYSRVSEGAGIRVIGVDGKNDQEIVKDDLVSPVLAFWAPDGKRLGVVVYDWEVDEKGRKFLKDLAKANFRIEVMDADGKNRRELKLEDGKFLFFGNADWR